MQLYNTLSAKERATILEEAGEDRLTLSFYKYAKIGNPELFRKHLFLAWDDLEVLGRIYVAHEGINAQLSVPGKKFNDFKNFLDGIYFLENCRLNIAVEQHLKSFLKLKIKVRHKIVADGLSDDTFDVTDIGVHVNALKFNDLIEDPDTVLVDMRNHYESEIGHFKNAITPDVDTFRDSLDIIEEDLKDVFQLEGGIIEYTRQVNEQDLENKFIGKNFVFDHRRSERISDDVISNCHQCGSPSDTHINCANEACHLLFIQCEVCSEKMELTCSDECRDIIHLTYEEQKELRKGKQASNKIFKKGRSSKLTFKK